MPKIALFQYSSNPYSQSVTATYCQPPFGMLIKERSYTSDSYRFGFNGKEKDDEIHGDGDSYDYGFRIYNPRLGRFLSVDPLFQSYPWYTPYQFAGNKPIAAIDVDGLEDKINTDKSDVTNAESKLMMTDEAYVYGIVKSIEDILLKAWDDTGMPNSKNVVETGGAIVKNQKGEISTHRYKKSSRPGAVQLKRSYRNIPKGSQLIGDFHTHPYSKAEIKKNKLQNFDGTGVGFSRGDFMSTPFKAKTGFVAIVYSGDGEAMAMEITNKKVFKKFYSLNDGSIDFILKNIEDQVNEILLKNPNLKYDEVYNQTLIKVLNDNDTDLGFKLYKLTGVGTPSTKVEKVYEFKKPVESNESNDSNDEILDQQKLPLILGSEGS